MYMTRTITHSNTHHFITSVCSLSYNSSCYSAVRLCAPPSTIYAQTVQDSINFFGFVATHLHFTDGAVHSPVLYQYNLLQSVWPATKYLYFHAKQHTCTLLSPQSTYMYITFSTNKLPEDIPVCYPCCISSMHVQFRTIRALYTFTHFASMLLSLMFNNLKIIQKHNM
jgi:hypothetical protein